MLRLQMLRQPWAWLWVQLVLPLRRWWLPRRLLRRGLWLPLPSGSLLDWCHHWHPINLHRQIELPNLKPPIAFVNALNHASPSGKLGTIGLEVLAGTELQAGSSRLKEMIVDQEASLLLRMLRMLMHATLRHADNLCSGMRHRRACH